MDPTLIVCSKKISLLEPDPELIETDLPDPLYRHALEGNFTEKIRIRDDATETVVETIDRSDTSGLTELGEILLELSPLSIDESIVAANIDAIFKFTGHIHGILNPQTPDRFSEYTFIDLFGAPGGFTEYLQWRRPHSYGFGLAETSESRREITDWNTTRLNLHEFRTFEYDSNLTSFDNYKLFIGLIGNRDIDLVYGLSDDPSLLLFEIVTSLRLIKNGGNIIIKLPDTLLEAPGIVDLIYLVSMCFGAVCMFRPLSSTKVYLIGWNASSGTSGTSGTSDKVLQLLISLLKNNIDIRRIDTLVQGDLPTEFEEWFDRQYYVSEVLNPNEYNISKILTVWGIPITSKLSEKNSSDGGVSSRIGTMYRSLIKLDPTYLNEFFFNTVTNLTSIDEAIHRLSVRTGMDEMSIRTRIDAIPRRINLEVDKTDILTSITTSQGFKLKMKTNRFEFLTDEVKNPIEEVADLIDRYSFFGMECLKFEFKDLVNHLTEAISSPLTNTLSNYYSLYSNDSIFGSKGTFDDMINSELDNLIFIIPPNVKLMDVLYDKLKDSDSRELYFVAPYWPDHPLIKWIQENGKMILSTRDKVFTRLDFSKVTNPKGKIIIGYTGKSYDNLLEILP